jgi:hypothetical protein
VKTRKVAHFAAGKNKNPPPFTLSALTMARRDGNRAFVYAIFTPNCG